MDNGLVFKPQKKIFVFVFWCDFYACHSQLFCVHIFVAANEKVYTYILWWRVFSVWRLLFTLCGIRIMHKILLFYHGFQWNRLKNCRHCKWSANNLSVMNILRNNFNSFDTSFILKFVNKLRWSTLTINRPNVISFCLLTWNTFTSSNANVDTLTINYSFHRLQLMRKEMNFLLSRTPSLELWWIIYFGFKNKRKFS